MRDPTFRPEWRTQSRAKRRFYAKYMKWIVTGGFVFVALGLTGIVTMFVWRIDETVETSGGEPATVEARSAVVQARQETGIARVLVQDFATVKRGQPILQVGEGAVPARAALFARALNTTGPTFRRQPVLAPSDGVLRLSEAAKIGLVPAGGELFRVVDYRQILVTAKLTGEKVPDAAVGQKAVLSQFDLHADGKTRLRVDTGKGEEFASELVLADAPRQALDQALKGTGYRVRNDRDFRFVGTDSVEVEVIATEGGAAAKRAAFDPPRTVSIQATVTEGRHLAKLQFSDLPPAARKALDQAVRSRITGRTLVEPAQGREATLGTVQSVAGVVVANVEAPAVPRDQAPKVEGGFASVVERSFEAKIRLDNPPAWLVEALRRADRDGRKVRAKVTVVTGTRPAALRLLRRG